jgi:hypothetical protein
MNEEEFVEKFIIKDLKTKITYFDVSLVLRSLNRDICNDLHHISKVENSKVKRKKLRSIYSKIYKQGRYNDMITNQKAIIRTDVNHGLAWIMLNNYIVVN